MQHYHVYQCKCGADGVWREEDTKEAVVPAGDGPEEDHPDMSPGPHLALAPPPLAPARAPLDPALYAPP